MNDPLKDPLPPNEVFYEALKVIGLFVLVFVIIGVLTATPASVEALVILLAIVLGFFALKVIVWLTKVLGTALGAFFQMLSNIRRAAPKVKFRAPTKREIAEWLAGTYREQDKLLDEAPLKEHERDAGKKKNKIDYIHKLNDLMEDK